MMKKNPLYIAHPYTPDWVAERNRLIGWGDTLLGTGKQSATDAQCVAVMADWARHNKGWQVDGRTVNSFTYQM